jgi:pimeloyl-ACP methyl ester carboxylesterase
MQLRFDGKAFDYQTLRALSYATFEGAEPGEVLVTVDGIPEGDTDAWHTEWRRTGARVERQAEAARDAGRERTARFAFQRAFTYLKTAEFFLAPEDPRRRPTHQRARAAFRAAMALRERSPAVVEIPYEDAALPGYLFRAGDASGSPPGDVAASRPLVVCLGGFDSLGEELYFLCGVPEALARGFDVLLFEGPGQGAPLRYAGLSARPDWEHVVGPVLDFVDAADESIGLEAAPSAIALVGVSMGGYYAPRAAAFDDRVDAVVAFDHMHSLWDASARDAPRLARAMLHVPDAVVNALAVVGSRASVDGAWFMSNGKWVFGADSAAALQRELRRYDLTEDAHRIECPTLVLAGEDDHFVPLGMAREFADLASGPTTVRVFRTEEGAGEHCQVGNLRLATGTIYDWLDETLDADAD